MPRCLVCDHPYEVFLDFGPMPIANGFLTPEQFAGEYFFDLRVGFCPRCYMVQLAEQPQREMMFHQDYAYFSSISTRMAEHFARFAEMVKARFLGSSPFVVELGSNDGIMLRHFAQAGIAHLGVEPSANVAEAARAQGIDTVCEFFDQALAARIQAERGQADAVLAANVMCHIPYLHSVAEGVASLLKPQGVLIFEDPYLGDIIEKTSYDQIYDEHAFYFSVASVEAIFRPHGLEVVDVAAQNVHGGSMRYFIARAGARPVAPAVAAQKAKEDALGLKDAATYDRFRANVERSRDELRRALTGCRERGQRVVGYGATSKSTTVTNYCGLGPELIEFISDTTPGKQGKFSPGAHLPVKPYDAFSARHPEVALLFAWNHGEEIMAKESAFKAAGGRWLVYVPRVEFV